MKYYFDNDSLLIKAECDQLSINNQSSLSNGVETIK